MSGPLQGNLVALVEAKLKDANLDYEKEGHLFFGESTSNEVPIVLLSIARQCVMEGHTEICWSVTKTMWSFKVF